MGPPTIIANQYETLGRKMLLFYHTDPPYGYNAWLLGAQKERVLWVCTHGLQQSSKRKRDTLVTATFQAWESISKKRPTAAGHVYMSVVLNTLHPRTDIK